MSFLGRCSFSIENEQLRLTVLEEGGHIAELFHKKSALNPLWIPPWPTGEPSTYDAARMPEYGLDSESKLLLGIMGHNLCLDNFGPPSEAEAGKGLTVHGEASVARYKIERQANGLVMSAHLPLACLSFERTLSLDAESVIFHESVTNLSAHDRPIAWTQHVTLGPPFVTAKTQFAIDPLQSRTFENPAIDDGVMQPAADFNWPAAPLANGGSVDLRVFGPSPFSRFTTHLMKGAGDTGFAAFSPEHGLLIGYRWRAVDFPWLGLWQENKKRSAKPWNNQGITCGFEFGVSPFPETRRKMIDRSSLFGVPAYRWISPGETLSVVYRAFVQAASELALNA